MRIAVTGASGTVGGFVAVAARAGGHEVVSLGRTAPRGLAVSHRDWRLGESADLRGVDAVIHAALAHVPGRFRGGEGDDPAGFEAANLAGTRRLFADAARAGARVVLLSSRAVFDGWPAGSWLPEGRPPRPASLYGEVKAALEADLARVPGAVALRATGVYGRPARGWGHKWQGLLADLTAGRDVAPRVGGEVHGADVADAVLRLLGQPQGGVWHVADLMLDRADLAAMLGAPRRPARADAAAVSRFGCDRLAATGWRPGGWARLRAALPDLRDG